MDKEEIVKRLTELKDKWIESANIKKGIAKGLYPPSGHGPLDYVAQREYSCAMSLDKVIKEIS